MHLTCNTAAHPVDSPISPQRLEKDCYSFQAMCPCFHTSKPCMRIQAGRRLHLACHLSSRLSTISSSIHSIVSGNIRTPPTKIGAPPMRPTRDPKVPSPLPLLSLLMLLARGLLAWKACLLQTSWLTCLGRRLAPWIGFRVAASIWEAFLPCLWAVEWILITSCSSTHMGMMA